MASIVKRPDRPRPWLVGWRDPDTKKQCWKSFTLKREAEDFSEKVSQGIRGGMYVSPKPVPFKPYALDWLERKRALVTPNAHGVHRWAVEGHLIPAFGMMPLQNLRADRIERFQADLLTRGDLSPRSVQIVRQVLASILKDARKKGSLLVNAMEAVDRIPVPKRDLRFLTAEQMAPFCEAAGGMYGMLFALQALCGLRAGEALALRWEDMNLETGRLTVSRQVIWRRAKDRKPDEPSWQFTAPKSEAGKRMLEIPPALVQGLTEYRAWRNGSAGPGALVFSTKQGTPLCQRNVRRRHFQPALKRLGLTGIRPHDFRRTYVALHVASGTHPKLVQTRMGHTKFSLTMDVYGKLAGDIALQDEQTVKFNALAAQALPDPLNIGKPEHPKPAGAGWNAQQRKALQPANSTDYSGTA